MAESSKKTAAGKTKTAKTAKKAKKAKKASAPSSAGRNLVVVESPAKAKTINRYLGDDYIVKASMGHVRDLPRKEIGVDFARGFKPTYVPLARGKKVLSELGKLARAAPAVFLATDMDREGEAIAWHLAEGLGIPKGKIRRVVFNEITPDAIREAFDHPRQIDMDKVNAQQARRILDRIVGYQVSPLLWKKVSPGLSAGRVQTVAVRLIVDREREIDAFRPEEYWKIAGIFTADCDKAGELGGRWARFLDGKDAKGNSPTAAAQSEFLADLGVFRAELAKWKGERFRTEDSETALEIARALGLAIEQVQQTKDPKGKGPAATRLTVIGGVGDKGPDFKVAALNQRQSRSRPLAPLTTSSLQQAASVQLYFSARKTMRIAQQLYEGVEAPGEGSVGLITYMRTDSRRLSAQAVAAARTLIAEQFGPKYVPEKPNVFASGERAQEAHEAVRPTDVGRRPQDLMASLTNDQYKLYRLIWNRMVACQMTPAVWRVTEADIAADTRIGQAIFRAIGRTLVFDGFMAVTGRPRGGDQILPELHENQPVAPVEIDPTQHFTQPPPRYTEASLVKALEADNIGRPSTYAAIIQTIQDREYVKLESRAFHPTSLGLVVTDKLVKHFPREFQTRFTAHMEDELDKVEDATMDWGDVLKEFYGPFKKDLDRAAEEMVHAKAETEPSEYTCGTCGKAMIYRWSKTGRYLACTGYPDCKQTYPVDDEGQKIEQQTVDVACPKCSSAMVLRRGRYGPFLSCGKYPDCDGIVKLDKKGLVKPPAVPPLQVDLACAKCGSPLNLRRGKRGPWLSCSKYPKCRGRLGWKNLEEDRRKQLEHDLVEHEKANPQPVIKTVDGDPVGDEHTPRPVEEKPAE